MTTQGILLITGITNLMIAFLVWLTFPKFDKSAQIWVAALCLSSLAPIYGATSSIEYAATFAIVSASMALGLLLYGLSLKVLADNDVSLVSELKWQFTYALFFALVILIAFLNFSLKLQALCFAFGNLLASGWATYQAYKLKSKVSSNFANHLTIILGAQSLFFLMRFIQSISTYPVRLNQDASFETTLVTLIAILLIIKSVSYISLRFQLISNQVIHDSEIIRIQSLEIAERNSELVEALNSAPLSCVVTDKNLNVIYINTQATHLLGTDIQIHTPNLKSILIGCKDLDSELITGLQYVFVKKSNTEILLSQLSSNPTDKDSLISQLILVFNKTPITKESLHLALSDFPNEFNRYLIAIDETGDILNSQQSIFHFFKNHLSVSDMNSCKNFRDLIEHTGLTNKKMQPIRTAQHLNFGHSLLLRDNDQTQLNANFYQLSDIADSKFYLIEIHIKKLNIRNKIKADRSLPTALKSINQSENTLDKNIPIFLKNRPQTND